MIEFRGACARHRAALLDFVDHGEIVAGTAPALAHLERCARCTDELESTVLAITALRRFGDELARAEPSPEAWPRLRARIETLRPARWAIMSPSAGMVMSIALVAVLVAPFRVGTTTSSSAPTYLPSSQLGVSLEEVMEGIESANAYSTLSLDAGDASDESANSMLDSLGIDDEALANVEIRASVKPLIEQLPPRERRILLLRFFGGMTQSQIAEEIGVSQMHVSRLLNRTLAQLRTSMRDVS